ncbi:MAG: hypothetical protein IKQ34_03965 [Bacilli bacterium]|nr:hypothetical protein [Bacilli bacterium]MBR6056494.1 hypothetical protein [Bacilli bacterium]
MRMLSKLLPVLSFILFGVGQTAQQGQKGPKIDNVNYWCQEDERIVFDFGTNTVFERRCPSIVVSHPFGNGCRVSSFGGIDINWNYNDSTSFTGDVYLPAGDSQTTITFISEEREKHFRLYSSEIIDGGWAVSALSMDDARMLAGNLENQALMDGDKPISSKSKGPLEGNNHFRPAKAAGFLLYSGNVSGTVSWSDDNGHTYPLVNAKVKLTFKDTNSSVETQTNSIGYYSLDYVKVPTQTNILKIYVHVYLENPLIKAANEDVVYESVSVIEHIYGPETHSLIYSTNSDFGRAACAFAGATAFADHACSLSGGALPNQCILQYPSNEIFQYKHSSKTIFIDNSQDFSIIQGPKSYLSWDVIGHEYGHHLQIVFGFYNGYSGGHYSGASDILQAFEHAKEKGETISDENAKAQGLGLAWVESWPTFFSIVSQYSFPSYLDTVPFLKDKYLTQPGQSIGYSIDSDELLLGEGCERTIMAFLYKLWDSENCSPYDNISISEQSLWQLVVNTAPDFLHSFVKYLYDSNLSFDRNDLGLLLEGLRLSASNISASSGNNYSNLPVFSWDKNGYSFSFDGVLKQFDNDKFMLRFYDEDKYCLFERIVYGGSVALNQTEWNQILCSVGSNYYITIESYDTLGFQSGPYYSGFHRFSKPASASYSAPLNTLEAKRYYERELAIAPGTQWTVTLNFPTSGLKAIQTFSNKDTELYLYNSNGTVLIDYDDDSGFSRNAYLVLDATAGVDYKLKVNFYNSQIGGMVKLSVTPFDGALGNNQTDFSAVNHFVDINTYPNFTWGSYLTLNNSEIITWTPPGVGNYTVWLESQFDNYLYIINPNSHKPLQRNVDFNDDSNGANASLTINTQPGIKYLIIYSQYNPSSPFPNGNSDISVHFQKNN